MMINALAQMEGNSIIFISPVANAKFYSLDQHIEDKKLLSIVTNASKKNSLQGVLAAKIS